MNEKCTQIFKALSKHRFVLSDEKRLQLEIEHVFNSEGILFNREFFLDKEKKDIIDFLIDGRVGVEVKIKCNKRAMYKQLLRYSESEHVESLILVTGTNTGMPKELNGKPVYILNISRAWL